LLQHSFQLFGQLRALAGGQSRNPGGQQIGEEFHEPLGFRGRQAVLRLQDAQTLPAIPQTGPQVGPLFLLGLRHLARLLLLLEQGLRLAAGLLQFAQALLQGLVETRFDTQQESGPGHGILFQAVPLPLVQPRRQKEAE
jgi:hypothetical protein